MKPLVYKHIHEQLRDYLIGDLIPNARSERAEYVRGLAKAFACSERLVQMQLAKLDDYAHDHDTTVDALTKNGSERMLRFLKVYAMMHIAMGDKDWVRRWGNARACRTVIEEGVDKLADLHGRIVKHGNVSMEEMEDVVAAVRLQNYHDIDRQHYHKWNSTEGTLLVDKPDCVLWWAMQLTGC